ncbi:MAG: HAD family hydrolase [Thermoplasmata archaeon]|nr:HAD family hydrolase [Thermoplasmata archaeon]
MNSKKGGLRAVFFDLGGTLIDERNPLAWSECAAAAGLELGPDELVHFFGEVEAENDAVGNRWHAEEFWQRVLERAAGGPVDPPRVDGFVACIREHGSAVHLFSDVRRCLEEVESDGYALGIISNSQSEEWVRSLLQKVRILKHFDTIVSSGTEGVAKPDAAIFRRALDRLGLSPAEAFHVGNLANVDAKAALAAGLGAVWLHRGGTGFGDDPPEITSLSELPGELRAVRPRAR